MNHIGIDFYETKKHGTASLPFAVYLSRIPEKLSFYPMHWHEEMEIIYVESGACLVTIDGERIHAEQEELILISPGMTHAIDQVEECSAVYYNIIFHPEMLMTGKGRDGITKAYLEPLQKGEKVFSKRIPLAGTEGEQIRTLVLRLLNFRSSTREEGQGFLVKSAALELLYHL